MTPQHQDPPTDGQAVLAASAQAAPGFWRRPSTARILPFAAYMAFIAIADLLAHAGLTADQLRWLYPVKTGVVVALLLVYRKMYVELIPRRISVGSAVASVVTGIVVLVLWVNLDAGWMQVGVSEGFNPVDRAGRIDWMLVAWRIAGAALVVPLMEELFWRSFLMRWLARSDFLNVYPAQVGMQALVLTVVLFGFEHNLWLAGIVAGLAYSLLYMRTGNIWSPILAHAVTNGLLGVWVVATASWTYW